MAARAAFVSALAAKGNNAKELAATATQANAAGANVAQICNLPYRRIEFCWAPDFFDAFGVRNASQNAILRYSRLQICATVRRNGEKEKRRRADRSTGRVLPVFPLSPFRHCEFVVVVGFI